MEIESSTDWQAYDPPEKEKTYNQVTGEHRLLWQDGPVRLETELSGKLEFVIEPPAQTTDELVDRVKRAEQIAGLLLDARTKKAKGFDDFALAHFMKTSRQSRKEILHNKKLRPYVIKKINLLELNKVVPGAKQAFVSSSSSFPGGFQATVGVHLSAVPALFEWMKDVRSFPKPELLTRARETSERARENSIELPFTWYNQMSPSMEGLLNLIYYYIYAGNQARERRPFPKGITQVMARTNFAKMFSMTPEAAFFSARPEYWVKYVSEAGGFDPNQRIFQGSFGDTEQDESIISLTRGQWLLDMVGTDADLGRDLLSVRGGGPELLKTMGDLDKTDDLGATEDSDRGVILELRGLDAYTITHDRWSDFAREIGNGVDELNQRQQNSAERLKANQDVAEAGQGAKLFWSPWSAEVRGGKDVYAMAIEAYKVPFRSQVKALITRARARAKEAIDLREFG
ncbi:MAG: hypothetical protein E4H40_06500 [Candidatus Brocadiia bacterium]|nr:MAG: hypothetical protein E4H40_06500 [Candidatus Brocadiia bacterium]